MADHQKAASFPRFGDWEESKKKAEGYTVIFNEVKEKKQTAATQLPEVLNNAAGSKIMKGNKKMPFKMLRCFYPSSQA